MSDKPTRPEKSPAPDRADYAPNLLPYPDYTEPAKGSKSDTEHRAEVESARAEHDALTASVAASNTAAREEAEAAYAEAAAAHEAAWQASLDDWKADLRAYREAMPGHPLAGAWLAANPVEGVVCEDAGDGLGPRLEGWPREREAPDFETFAAEHEAAERDAARRREQIAEAVQALRESTEPRDVVLVALAEQLLQRVLP